MLECSNAGIGNIIVLFGVFWYLVVRGGNFRGIGVPEVNAMKPSYRLMSPARDGMNVAQHFSAGFFMRGYKSPVRDG
jgi:hypothetical protein